MVVAMEALGGGRLRNRNEASRKGAGIGIGNGPMKCFGFFM